jgi:spermidine synthase
MLRRASLVAFLCSGFGALVVQVVWLRLAFASFGIITPVVSVVVSVFMAGLGLGSVLGGRIAKRLTARAALAIYAAVEVSIGVLAVLVNHGFLLGQRVLLGLEGTSSASYLFASAVAIAVVLLLPCTLMGMTYPLMLAAVRRLPGGEGNFGRLYVANTIGAAAGACASVLLIEVLGFRATLHFAAMAYAFAAFAAFSARRDPILEAAPDTDEAPEPRAASPKGALGAAGAILFATGFASMGMEIAWTRAFAPALGHLVYSFAGLLAVFLIANGVGGALYRRGVGKRLSTPQLLALVALGSIVPLFWNDVRVAPLEGIWPGWPLLSIVPFCLGLGALTPRIVDEVSRGDPAIAARAYAVNIVGCVLGPLFVSYVLLPQVGASVVLALLAAPLALLAGRALRGAATAAAAVAMVFAVFIVCDYEDPTPRGEREATRILRRDATATVISSGTGHLKQLHVNGEPLTALTPITRHMAHLPLLAVKEPRAGLVICVGMGTTWRSLMSWPIAVTGVELVPSVVEALPYYFDDIEEMLRDPRGKIVVDDGRRFLQRTDEMFDVITLDPPPPLEAAGVGMLYSDEFYRLVKRRLRPGGVLQTWIMASPGDVVVAAVTRSILDAFPHVRAFSGVEGWGVHFLASDTPIDLPSPPDVRSRLPARAVADLDEMYFFTDGPGDLALVLSRELDPRALLLQSDVRMADDLPLNEYWLLRRFFGR